MSPLLRRLSPLLRRFLLKKPLTNPNHSGSAGDMDETIEQYIARGGVIKRYRSRADEIAAKIRPRSKYVQYDVLRDITAAKNRKRQLTINARKKQSSKPVTRRKDRASQPT